MTFPDDGSKPLMTEGERKAISEFIEQEFGIKMPPSKKTLLEARLAKRLIACGIHSYGEYFRFITESPQGADEFLRFTDLVSTHETNFFRESKHFDFLSKKVFPALLENRNLKSIELLSAACSTGEEAYSLAMTLDRALRDRRRDVPFHIEGVDLSERAVAIAKRGVYLPEQTKNIPPNLVLDYLMHSKDRNRNLLRVVPELRQRTFFHTGNLLNDLSLTKNAYDFVFCRNVLIYFEPATQRRAIVALMQHLKPNGYLFLGHAETMVSLDLPLKSVAHAVYQRS